MEDALSIIVSLGAIAVFLFGASTVKGWISGGTLASPAPPAPVQQLQPDDDTPLFQFEQYPLQNFDVGQLAQPTGQQGS